MELTIPGFAPPGRMPLWWAVFHQTPDVPDVLVEGKEMIYLTWFFHNLPFNPAAITQTDINEYVSHYSAPGGMRAGLSTIELSHRTQFKIRTILRLSLQCLCWH